MITIFKVEQSDLVGKIEGFPIEVVQKMVEEQIKQGNECNIKAFQKSCISSDVEGGFNWNKTTDGHEFWYNVIYNQDFNVFFKKYPKKPNLVYIVGDSEVGMDIIKTLEKYGGINEHYYKGNSENCVYYIEPNNNFIEICDFNEDTKLWEVLMATYTPIDAEESVLEVTMKDIAEKFGVDVNNLRIKE